MKKKWIQEWIAIPFPGGIFLTQGWDLRLLHYRKIPYHWATREAQWLHNIPSNGYSSLLNQSPTVGHWSVLGFLVFYKPHCSEHPSAFSYGYRASSSPLPLICPLPPSPHPLPLPSPQASKVSTSARQAEARSFHRGFFWAEEDCRRPHNRLKALPPLPSPSCTVPFLLPSDSANFQI